MASILLIDPHLGSGRSTARLLASEGYEVQTAPSVSFGTPSVAFQTSLTTDAAGMTYTITADAKQALVVREATGSGASTEYRLVFNWFEDLKPRLRIGK
jgi:hypothetical protein